MPTINLTTPDGKDISVTFTKEIEVIGEQERRLPRRKFIFEDPYREERLNQLRERIER